MFGLCEVRTCDLIENEHLSHPHLNKTPWGFNERKLLDGHGAPRFMVIKYFCEIHDYVYRPHMIGVVVEASGAPRREASWP